MRIRPSSAFLELSRAAFCSLAAADMETSLEKPNLCPRRALPASVIGAGSRGARCTRGSCAHPNGSIAAARAGYMRPTAAAAFTMSYSQETVAAAGPPTGTSRGCGSGHSRGHRRPARGRRRARSCRSAPARTWGWPRLAVRAQASRARVLLAGLHGVLLVGADDGVAGGACGTGIPGIRAWPRRVARGGIRWPSCGTTPSSRAGTAACARLQNGHPAALQD